MKSTIRIDYVDLGEGQGVEPVISINIENSDDPRDKLLKTLIQSAHSGYLQIKYDNTNYTPNDYNRRVTLSRDPKMEEIYRRDWESQVGKSSFFPFPEKLLIKESEEVNQEKE